VKLNDHFKTLLTDTVNLNQDRLDQLDERVTSTGMATRSWSGVGVPARRQCRRAGSGGSGRPG
jgi:hypothetical protein